MWKKFSLLFLILMTIFGFGFKGCKKSVGSGGGGAGGEWEYVRSVSSFWVLLPERRPPLYTTPRGVKVYSFKPPSAKMLGLVDQAITNQLARSSWDNPKFQPADWWRSATNFDEHREYAVLFIEPTYRSVSRPGCGLIHVRAGGEAVTAIETLAGVQIINGIPRAPGGLYIVVAGWFDDEPVESDCDELRLQGVDHGSEHARLMDKPDLFFDLQANDVHKYFTAPNGEGSRPAGAREAERQDYEYPKGRIVEYPRVTLSSAEIEKLGRRQNE